MSRIYLGFSEMILADKNVRQLNGYKQPSKGIRELTYL